MFKKKKEEDKTHDLITIFMRELPNGNISYGMKDLNNIVNSYYILDSLGASLGILIKQAKQNNIKIPDKLKGFKYQVKKVNK